MPRTDTEPPARPAAALSCYPKWKRRPWDSPGRMGNRGRCRKTCKVRGETQGATPPRTLGFPSAQRSFVLPKKFAAVACERPRHGPLRTPPSPCLRGPAFRVAQRVSRARVPGPRRRQGPSQKVQTEPRSRQASGEPTLGCRRRTLPGPAADPGDLALIPVPRKTASEFMAGGVTRGSSGEHPVCHIPSRNGTRGLCPAGAAPTGTVQVAVTVTRYFAGAPTPWWICGVPRKAEGCSSWDGARNVCGVERDRAVLGAPLGAGAVCGGRRRRPRRGSAPCLGAGTRYARPAPRDSPGTETPVPAAL